jgi:sn-glycerol 3-phosphate transport system substrate-binding protein
MSRRTWPSVAAVAAVALLIGACSSSSPNRDRTIDGVAPGATPPTCTVKLPPKSPTPTVVTVVESFDLRAATAAASLVAQFNASQHQIKVVLQPATSDSSVQQQVAHATTASSAPGLVVLDDIRAQSVADSGKVLPASTCIKAAGTNTSVFLPAAKSYYTVEGQLMAGSANLSVPILYFDRTAFKAAGIDPTHPPQTLDEVYQDAVKLKQVAPTSVPLAMTESSWWVETWLTGAGSAIVNNNNGRSAPADGSTFNSAKSVAIHQWMQKMYAADLVDLVPDTGGQHDAELDLADRKSAMLFDSSTSIPDMDALMAGTLDPTTWNLPAVTVLPPPGPSLDLDVAPMPGLEFPGRGQVSGSAWYLTSKSAPATQAAAWTFLTWWNQPAQQAAWNLQGTYLPYNTQAVNRSGLQQVWQNTRKGHWLDTAYTELTNFDTQAPGPLIGPYSAVRAAIVQSLTDVTAGGMDPQIVVTETDQTIEGDLVEYTLAHS